MTEHQMISSPVPVAASLPMGQFITGNDPAADGKCLPPRGKLPIGAAGDRLEREADVMADRVMRMPETPFIRRKCAHCEEEEKAQRKPLAAFVQRKDAGIAGMADSEVSNRINATRGTGDGLPEDTRSFMENRMGADFSSVRIHTGDYAAQLSQQLNAQAFTVGNDIYFNAGKFSPGSSDGKHLLAHELVHTVQQGGGKAPAGESAAGLIQRRLIVRPATIPGTGGAPGRPFTNVVRGLINEICPSGNFAVDGTTGVVSTSDRRCQWHAPMFPRPPVGCLCLCDVINRTETTTIEFVAGTEPGTLPNRVGGVEQGWEGSGTTGSPTIRIDPAFQGQYRINGRWVDIPFFLIFAHELCGHALPLMQGTSVTRGPRPSHYGTPPHERYAVDVERQIAAEHDPPLPRRSEDYLDDARPRP